MKPSERHIHLGMFETPELIQELTNRLNFEFVIGVRFVDGSSNADRDTVYCAGRWDDESRDDLLEAICDYLTTAEDEEDS